MILEVAMAGDELVMGAQAEQNFGKAAGSATCR